jgi:hypothetical protein
MRLSTLAMVAILVGCPGPGALYDGWIVVEGDLELHPGALPLPVAAAR